MQLLLALLIELTTIQSYKQYIIWSIDTIIYMNEKFDKKNDSITKYLNEISMEPLLSSKEEIELAGKIQKGELASLERLFYGDDGAGFAGISR